jgi:hypothetical protein
MKRSRHPGGNMILMSVMVLGVVIVLVLAGVGVMFLFTSHQKAQNTTDSVALQAASVLNAHDRAGQMNNLVARCRELVYTSRETYDEAAANLRHLEPLARQLLDESRQSAHLVEAERARLCQQELDELKRIAVESASGEVVSTVSGITTKSPQITTITVGHIEGIPSNVEVSKGVPELFQRDMAAGLIEPRSGLYNGNINAKLPGVDTDLDFRISSLPAPVKGTIAPARLATASVFRQTGQAVGESQVGRVEQLPSAVQVKFNMKVSAAGDKKGNDVALGVTAVSNGAQPSP